MNRLDDIGNERIQPGTIRLMKDAQQAPELRHHVPQWVVRLLAVALVVFLAFSAARNMGG